MVNATLIIEPDKQWYETYLQRVPDDFNSRETKNLPGSYTATAKLSGIGLTCSKRRDVVSWKVPCIATLFHHL